MVFPLNRIVAPMVGQSDAPFRSLCLKYGATCAYTEMFESQKIVEDDLYLESCLPSADHRLQEFGYPTRPLVVQVCGNDPLILSEAVAMIAKTGRADAIDFNLGCPQEKAKLGLFGSYLLDKCHWHVVFDCVRAMITALQEYDIPLFCKIRLIEGSNVLDLTRQFCFGLYDCGVRVICIHGRTRGSTKRRRVGPADLETIAKIASDLHSYHHSQTQSQLQLQLQSASVWNQQVIVISNGNIISPDDIIRNAKIFDTSETSQFSLVGGYMSGEGILKDPAIFQRYIQLLPSPPAPPPLNQPTSEIGPPSLGQLFTEYCHLSLLYSSLRGWDGFNLLERRKLSLLSSQQESPLVEPKEVSVARQHLNWMLRKSGHGRLIRYEHKAERYTRHTDQMDEINRCTNIQELLQIAEIALPHIDYSHSHSHS